MAETVLTATIYHNPRCSNSRGALALLQAHGVRLEVVEYLKTPPTRERLTWLFEAYAGAPADLVRFKEASAKARGLTRDTPEAQLLDALEADPVLLQRPIVVLGDDAIIARPPDVLGSWLPETR